MSPMTDQLAYFLQAVGYRTVTGYPYLLVYSHLLVGALFPIYTGAHASLSRPSSAAKPSIKDKKRDDDDDEPEEQEQRMEGLGPIDAILLPLVAALSLTTLYFLIKWLGDPTLLNKILNWYFGFFGIWALAQMIKDSMCIFASFVSPRIHDKDYNLSENGARPREFELISSPLVEENSPVSKQSSSPPLSSKVTNAMRCLRELLSRRLDVRVYIHKMAQGRFKIGPHDVISLFLAIIASLYFNLIGKPWWLTNLFGFSLAYNALQVMSPTTSWTGTLVLGGLFVYDIYFVFFTPLMVTVATQLEIPFKLLFPWPRRPTDDPTKRALSMLGLGDVILPGMMIGFALRFDLYLFYLHKQIQRTNNYSKKTEDTADDSANEEVVDSKVTKAIWHPATGGWGERFWTPNNEILRSKQLQGVLFPKTYFRASFIGYVLGMLCALGVMNIYGQAQPALLYLVPGVLGSFWGTALVKGDIKTLWAFDESEDGEEHTSASKSENQDSTGKTPSWMDVVWKSMFFSQRTLNESEKPTASIKSNDVSNAVGRVSDDGGKEDKAKGSFDRDRKNELIFISVSFPKAATAKSREKASTSEQAISLANVGHRTRAKTNVEKNDDDGLGETY